MRSDPSVVLVVMPWASSVRPSLSAGTLVSCAKRRGHRVRVEYPNLALATILQPEVYEHFAETPQLFPLAEHLFAADLFGVEALDSDEYIQGYFSKLGAKAEATVATRTLVRWRNEVVPAFIADWAERILDLAPDVVGFTCTFNQVLPSLALARRLRERASNLKIVMGGGSVHGAMGEAYARAFPQWVDHIFLGEADENFPRFLDALAVDGEIGEVDGITSTKRPSLPPEPYRDVGSLPPPDFDDFFQSRRDLRVSDAPLAPVQSLPFESSRGCWWGQKQHCTFCGLNGLGMAFRAKSAQVVIDELKSLSRRYGTTRFMAADNILDFRAYAELLPLLHDLEGDLDLFYEIKANLKRDQVADLAKAGVRWVQPGIESFSDHVLQLMRKGISALQNIAALKWLAEHRIIPSYNILVGFPGETAADYKQIEHISRRLRHLPPPSGTSAVVEVHRFSPFFQDPAGYGIEDMRPAAYYRHLFPPGTIDLEHAAYFFDRTIPDEAPVQRHRASLDAVLTTWIDKPLCLFLRLGPGFVEVMSDSRQEPRQPLARLPSALLVLADRPVARERLVNLAASLHAFQDLGVESIQREIEELSSEELLLDLGGQVLCPIPFDRPRRSGELRRWVSCWFDGRMQPPSGRSDLLVARRLDGVKRERDSRSAQPVP